MKSKGTLGVLAGCLAIGLPAVEGAKVPKSKTVVVDCRKGETVSSALQDEAEELIIEIRGTCREDVRVLRSNVTLRGLDPTVDGIRGVAKAAKAPALGATSAALEVRGSSVVLEKLRVAGGALYGLLAVGSQGVEVRSCRFVENAELGANFTGATAAVVSDTTFSGNGAGGVRVNRSSVVNFRGCVLGDNPSSGAGIGLEAMNGGRAFVEDSRVFGLVGVSAQNGAMVALTSSSVEGASLGLSVKSLGHLDLTDVALRGAISAVSKSLVTLRGVNQIASPRKNSLAADSTLHLMNTLQPETTAGESATVGTSLLGPTEVRQFSRVIFQGDALHAGDLTCSSGGDVFCQDPGKVAGTITNCASCRVKVAR